MTTQIGAPFIPPDNTTLQINASGQLEVKTAGVPVAALANGTDGELLTWDANGVIDTVATGNAGQVLTSNGAGAAPTFQTPSSGEAWTLIETLNPSGAASATTTGTITVYDEYLLVGTRLSASGSTNLKLKINADAGNNYASFYQLGTTDTLQTSQPNVEVVGVDTTNNSKFTIRLDGKTLATAGGQLGGIIEADGCAGNNVRGLGCRWTGGNATQITSVTILPAAGTFSGKIEVFGRNRNA